MSRIGSALALCVAVLLGVEPSRADGTIAASGVNSLACTVNVLSDGVNLFSPLATDANGKRIGTVGVMCNFPGSFRVTYASATGGRLNGPGGAFAAYNFRSAGLTAAGGSRLCSASGNGTYGGFGINNWTMSAAPFEVDYDNVDSNFLFLSERTTELCARVPALPSPLFAGTYQDTVTLTVTTL